MVNWAKHFNVQSYIILMCSWFPPICIPYGTWSNRNVLRSAVRSSERGHAICARWIKYIPLGQGVQLCVKGKFNSSLWAINRNCLWWSVERQRFPIHHPSLSQWQYKYSSICPHRAVLPMWFIFVLSSTSWLKLTCCTHDITQQQQINQSLIIHCRCYIIYIYNLFTSQYIWNSANVGVKYQSINVDF